MLIWNYSQHSTLCYLGHCSHNLLPDPICGKLRNFLTVFLPGLLREKSKRVHSASCIKLGLAGIIQRSKV